MNLIDLHVHSNHSDGSFSVEWLMKTAKEMGIELFSITDHDTITSQYEAVEIASKYEMNYITGVEINVVYPQLMDILGYGIDIYNEELIEFLDRIKIFRKLRNKKMVELLAEEGFNISFDELEEKYDSTTIGRPHIAKILIKKGYGNSVSQLMNGHLSRDRKCFVERIRYSPKESIEMIKKSQGKAFLAHPAKLGIKKTQLESLLDELIHYGLDGIEIMHYSHSLDYTKYLYELANKKDLLISYGSDYHGFNKPFVNMSYSVNEQTFDEIEYGLKK
ncbi:MAG: PHP domain-containing protein [Thermotogota bacterium]